LAREFDRGPHAARNHAAQLARISGLVNTDYGGVHHLPLFESVVERFSLVFVGFGGFPAGFLTTQSRFFEQPPTTD